MTAPELDLPQGSTAPQAFADAREVLARFELGDPRERPVFEYSLEDLRPHPRAGAAHGGGFGGTVPSGPLIDAVRETSAGRRTARGLVTDAFDSIDARSVELGAMAEVDEVGALATADALDAGLLAGERPGVLHGVPVTVKDVIDVAGMTTRAGSAAYLDLPATDATAVARLRAAGAVVIGKATTHEFALGVTSPMTSNPVDPTRLAGGSSGGSAVAVATGMGLASLGTDTRASIRVPAALSGVVGLKATLGRVPTDGVVSLAWTMDHVAPMATSVADAALVLEVLADAPGAFVGSTTRGASGLRIGAVDAAFVDAEPGLETVVRHRIADLAMAGADVCAVERPGSTDFDLANAAGLIVSRCEAAAFHAGLGLDRSRYWDEVGGQLDEADLTLAVDYLQAQRARRDLRDRMLQVFDTVDVLVMPTVPVVAPPVADFARYLMVLSRNAILWSFVGFPAISVPCGTVDGLPVGMQIVAAPWREDLVLATAAEVERATLRST